MYLCICGSICKHEYTYRILVYKPITYMHTPAAAKKEFDASAARMCSPLRVHINQFDWCIHINNKVRPSRRTRMVFFLSWRLQLCISMRGQYLLKGENWCIHINNNKYCPRVHKYTHLKPPRKEEYHASAARMCSAVCYCCVFIARLSFFSRRCTHNI